MRGYGGHLNQRVPNRATRQRHPSLCKWCRERTCCPNTVLAHTVLTNLGDGFALLCQHGQGVTNTQGGIPQEAQPVTRRTCACVGLCSDRLAVGSHYACDQQFRACATAFDKSAKINAVVQAHMQQQKQLYVAVWLCVWRVLGWLCGCVRCRTHIRVHQRGQVHGNDHGSAVEQHPTHGSSKTTFHVLLPRLLPAVLCVLHIKHLHRTHDELAAQGTLPAVRWATHEHQRTRCAACTVATLQEHAAPLPLVADNAVCTAA